MKKMFKSILAKYLDFLKLFLQNLAIKLLKYLGISKHIISLKKAK